MSANDIRHRPDRGSEPLRLVRFRVGDLLCALDIQHVREIVRTPDLGSAATGRFELRGFSIPVVRLGAMPGPTESRGSVDNRIVIVESPAGRVGISVDRVEEVIRVEQHAVQAPRPDRVSADIPGVRGVCEHAGRTILLLDPDVFIQRLNPETRDAA
tara:strand:+ start:11100 stop:11570 length:471 start_codon:yes stop_codon:yes gene_type:complete